MDVVKQVEPAKYRSENIGKIASALAQAQGEYKLLVANEEAPGTKFANLQAILEATRPALSKNELAFFQYIDLQDEGSGASLLISMLTHSSGEWISSRARIIMGKTDRSTGNIYEIHKRFHALMLLGIAPSKGDPLAFDDNGETLAKESVLDEMKKPEAAKIHIADNEPVTKDQYDDLLIELKHNKEIAKEILEVYGIETLADLPRTRYQPALQEIRRLKKVHEDYYNRR
jgi:hypothetical protein